MNIKELFLLSSIARRLCSARRASLSHVLAVRFASSRIAQIELKLDQLARLYFLEGKLGLEASQLSRLGVQRGLKKAGEMVVDQFGEELNSEWFTSGPTGFYNSVLSVMRGFLKRPEDVEDAMQEIFSPEPSKRNKYWMAGKKIRGFHPSRPPQDYLSLIRFYAANLARDLVRRRSTREKLLTPESVTESGETMEVPGTPSLVDEADAIMAALMDPKDPDARVVVEELRTFWRKKDDLGLVDAYLLTGNMTEVARQRKLPAAAIRMKWNRLLKSTASFLRGKLARDPNGKFARAYYRLRDKATMKTELGFV